LTLFIYYRIIDTNSSIIETPSMFEVFYDDSKYYGFYVEGSGRIGPFPTVCDLLKIPKQAPSIPFLHPHRDDVSYYGQKEPPLTSNIMVKLNPLNM
jgi:hypothetical protein